VKRRKKNSLAKWGHTREGKQHTLDFNSLDKVVKALCSTHFADHSFGNKGTNKRKVKTTTKVDKKQKTL
jgi:hypothetical protein